MCSSFLQLQCKIRTSLTLLVASKTLGTDFYVDVAPKSNGYTVYVLSSLLQYLSSGPNITSEQTGLVQ